jgi:hypothetical protein
MLTDLFYRSLQHGRRRAEVAKQPARNRMGSCALATVTQDGRKQNQYSSVFHHSGRLKRRQQLGMGNGFFSQGRKGSATSNGSFVQSANYFT